MKTNLKRGLFVLQFLFLAAYCSFSQSVGIGTITPDPSAALDITATNKGLLIPRMNINSINAIVNVFNLWPNPSHGIVFVNILSANESQGMTVI